MMNELLIHILETLKSIPLDFKTILERKIQLFVLDLGDSFSNSIAEAVPKFIGALLLLIGLFFGLMALSFWIGELLNSTALGFAIVSFIFLLFGLIGVSKKVNLEKSGTKRKIEQNFIELSDKIGQQEKPNSIETDTSKQLSK